MESESHIIENVTAWQDFVSQFRAAYTPSIICLQGPLGVGKTSFTKAFCQSSGIEEEVSSPTYSIIQEYGKDPIIYHMDLYRLDTIEDLWEIGIEDYLYSSNICIIEWPKLILENYTDLNLCLITIRLLDDGRREAEVSLINHSSETMK